MSMINKEHGIDTEEFYAVKNIMQSRFTTALTYYIDDTIFYLQDLNQGLITKDASRTYNAAHAIKSSGQQIGLIDTSSIAEEIEFSARSITAHEQTEDNIFKEIATEKLPLLKQSYYRSAEALLDYINNH